MAKKQPVRTVKDRRWAPDQSTSKSLKDAKKVERAAGGHGASGQGEPKLDQLAAQRAPAEKPAETSRATRQVEQAGR